MAEINYRAMKDCHYWETAKYSF